MASPEGRGSQPLGGRHGHAMAPDQLRGLLMTARPSEARRANGRPAEAEKKNGNVDQRAIPGSRRQRKSLRRKRCWQLKSPHWLPGMTGDSSSDFQSTLHDYSANNVMLIFAGQHAKAYEEGRVPDPAPDRTLLGSRHGGRSAAASIADSTATARIGPHAFDSPGTLVTPRETCGRCARGTSRSARGSNSTTGDTGVARLHRGNRLRRQSNVREAPPRSAGPRLLEGEAPRGSG